MSCRVDTAPLISGACVVSLYDGLGITGAALRSATSTGGTGAGLLYNDWDSGDDAKEFRALLVTAPSAGTLTLNEDGSFSLAGAADGTYSLTYRLFVDGADLGTASASITIGAGASVFSVAPAGVPSALAMGSPSVSFAGGSAFAVAAVSVASTMAFGAPSISFSGGSAFAVFPAGIGASLAVGVPGASFVSGGYFPAVSNSRRLVITVDPRLQGTSLPGAGGGLFQPYPFSPGSRLDIEWDWRPWMDEDDKLSSFEISWAGEEIGGISGQASAAGVVSTWLSVSADAEQGKRSALLCTVRTTEGRIDSRKYELLIKQL